MRLLAIDSATPRIVTGIVEDRDGDWVSLAEQSHLGARAHAEVLVPSIQTVSSDAAVPLSELDGIVVGLGPGPFTGLRVGIVSAAALADALAIPVWGVCTLDALAPYDGSALVVTDARRKEVYWARYDAALRQGEPQVAAPATLATDRPDVERVIESGAGAYLDELSAIAEVQSGAVTALALVRAADRAGLIGGAPNALTPIYLRRPDAAEPKARQRLDTIGPTAS